MRKITFLITTFLFLSLIGLNQVVSDFETDIEGWFSEGDGDYLWEMTTGNPGNNFRVNDDATGDINLSYAPPKFLGDWSNATTTDYISADIFLHQINGGYIASNFVFQIEGPGGKARALEGTNPTFDTWETFSVTIDQANWTMLEGDWNSLIQQVNELIVRMEYINGDEWNRLDNVELSFTPVIVPVVPVVCSDFESGGYDGWSFNGNGSVSDQSSGGNPGGYIRINNGSGTAVAQAPPKFLGDWSQVDNHNAEIHVDLKITDYTGNPYVHDFFMKIAGPYGEAKYPIGTNVAYAYDAWHTFTVPINETDWTLVSGTWSALLSNVNELQLCLEYFDGSERLWMDNFCITDLPPVVDFLADPLVTFPGNPVQFYDLSINGPSSWSWDFGDSGTSSDKNPAYAYSTPGVKDVSLTVSNHFGTDMITKTNYVEVLDDSQCNKYEDDFDDNSIHPVWQFRNGSWAESGGILRQYGNYYIGGNYLGACYALVGSSSWQDYIIHCDFQSTDDDAIGFVFNYQDESNMYMYLWRNQSNERILYKWENGTATILAQDAIPYVKNQWYHAEIATIGGNISVKIDGDEIFNVSDNTFTGGPAGLYCWANDESHYDNFKVSCEGSLIELTAFLEGPYAAGEMTTVLKDSNLLPLSQPYSGLPWQYTDPVNLDTMPDTTLIDWVMVEFRDAPDAASALPATKIEQKAAFILKDGSIVDPNGSSPIRLSMEVQYELFAVIHHRNHLPVMSASPLSLSGGIYNFDFTTGASQAYGSGAQKDLGSGVYGMYAGDLNADGTINSDDKSIEWEAAAGTAGYLMTDGNLDGLADNLDKNDKWLPNEGESKQLPE